MWASTLLDPSLCDRPPTNWIILKSHLTQMIQNPLLMTGLLLLFAALPWVIRPWPRKRLSTAVFLSFLLIYTLAPLGPIISAGNWGLQRWLPEDSGRSAQAIVILGRGWDPNRVEVAQHLWQEGRAPLIFASGVGDGPRMVKELRELGVPATALDSEDCSQTTEENADFSARILQAEGIHSILLVTDPPHLLRSWLTFKSLGFEVIPHPSEELYAVKAFNRNAALIVAREYFGLLSYGLQGRFFERQAAVQKPAQDREKVVSTLLGVFSNPAFETRVSG